VSFDTAPPGGFTYTITYSKAGATSATYSGSAIVVLPKFPLGAFIHPALPAVLHPANVLELSSTKNADTDMIEVMQLTASTRTYAAAPYSELGVPDSLYVSGGRIFTRAGNIMTHEGSARYQVRFGAHQLSSVVWSQPDTVTRLLLPPGPPTDVTIPNPLCADTLYNITATVSTPVVIPGNATNYVSPTQYEITVGAFFPPGADHLDTEFVLTNPPGPNGGGGTSRHFIMHFVQCSAPSGSQNSVRASSAVFSTADPALRHFRVRTVQGTKLDLYMK